MTEFEKVQLKYLLLKKEIEDLEAELDKKRKELKETYKMLEKVNNFVKSRYVKR